MSSKVTSSPKSNELPTVPEKDNKPRKNEKNRESKHKSKRDNEKKGFIATFKEAAVSDTKSSAIILLVYGIICLVFKSLHPVSICVSGSMEPVFYRGDLLISSGWKAPNYSEGDIVMWQLNRSPMIVHRIIKKSSDGRYLTQGDHNPVNDIGLYVKYGHSNPSMGLNATNIKSRIIYHIPKIGSPIMIAKENMIITCIISFILTSLWSIFVKKREFSWGETVYNMLSTISILILAKQLEVNVS